MATTAPAPAPPIVTPPTPIDLPPVAPTSPDTPPSADLPPSLYGIDGGGMVELGQQVVLTVGFFSAALNPTYEWKKDGVILAGVASVSYTIAAAAAADAGTYSVTVSTAGGSSATSTDVTVKPAAAPVITFGPNSVVRQVGQQVVFSYTGTGSYPRTHQWRKNGLDLPGGTDSGYTIPAVHTDDAGTYSVVVTNSLGSAVSAGASLTVNAATPPAFYENSPGDVTVTQGVATSLLVHLVAGSSPITYQWYKEGTVIAGANTQELSFKPAALADAGKYSVKVTNPAGSVTSREATLTVKPATPVSIYSQPWDVSIYAGWRARFSVSASGSDPISYRWFKDGNPIAGATNSVFEIAAAAVTDAGTYTVQVTNVAGSVTSSAAILTVRPATIPKILTQPQSQTINYGDTINLWVQVEATTPITYQWQKDGEPITRDDNSIQIYSAQPSHSGTYKVTITNPAGSVTSAAAIVTVKPARLATITPQPASVDVAPGLSASFFIGVDDIGSGRLSYRWRKNGLALPGATSSSFTIAKVTAADAGDYTVVVTGDAGVVTSAVARLSVLLPAPPQIRSWPFDTTTVGANPNFNIQAIGAGPFSYQWYKEGVPIPGATNEKLAFSPASDADLGVYTVTVTNAAGVVSSSPVVLDGSPWVLSPTPPWLDAGQVGDVVYFAATAPARVERYDLAGERWLPAVTLSQNPTAFAAADDGIYLALGRTLVRRSLDLATEIPVANAAGAITHVFIADRYVFHNAANLNGSGGQYVAVNRSTLVPAASSTFTGHADSVYRQVVYSPALHKGFGRTFPYTPTDIAMFPIAADGAVGASVDSIHGWDFPTANRVFLFPGEDVVADDSGTVYSTHDLAYAGSLGRRFADLAFLSDGNVVVLRERKVQAVRTDTFVETGSASLARLAVAARLFVRGSQIFVFGQAPAGAKESFGVERVAASVLTMPASPALAAPTTDYSVDDAFLGSDGVVHVFSRSLQALVRWSTATRSFLSSTGLRASPLMAFHQPESGRALFGYPDGELTEIRLQAGPETERPLGLYSLKPRGLADLDDMALINLGNGQDGGDLRLVLDAGGAILNRPSMGYAALGRAWQKATRRLYSIPPFSATSIQYEVIPASGVLPDNTATTGTISPLTPPFRFNAAGTLFATGNGRILNADLTPAGALGNDIADAAWLPGGLYTLRAAAGETEIQQWSLANYLLVRSVRLPGAPVRIFRLSDTQLVIVGQAQGRATFAILNADLSVAGGTVTPLRLAVVPQPQVAAVANSATLSVARSGGSGPASYQWLFNGVPVSAGTDPALTLPDVQPASAGLYTAIVSDGSGSLASEPAIVGISSTVKVVGSGIEVGANIVHPTGRIFDQVLLQGAAASIDADAGQVTRMSYVDMDDDVVQVEFSGAGTLALVLAGSSGPAEPAKYVQPGVKYMRGQAAVVITGADETTNVSVFSVGRANAVNQALFRPDVSYDGVADLAYIAILSSNGKFGGLRCANTNFFAAKGLTGLYAPGVRFTGPVYVGEITAFDDAAPTLILGSADGDTLITGGDLAQPNGRAVQVNGLTRLKFVSGTTSHGGALPAQLNQARLEQSGVDVTAQIVVNPTP